MSSCEFAARKQTHSDVVPQTSIVVTQFGCYSKMKIWRRLFKLGFSTDQYWRLKITYPDWKVGEFAQKLWHFARVDRGNGMWNSWNSPKNTCICLTQYHDPHALALLNPSQEYSKIEKMRTKMRSFTYPSMRWISAECIAEHGKCFVFVARSQIQHPQFVHHV